MRFLLLLAIASAPSLFAQPVVKQPCRTGVTTNCTPQADVNGSVAISGTALRGGGTSLPGTCTIGDQYFLTTGTTGNYSCTATNTWALPGSGGLVSYTGTATATIGVVQDGTCSSLGSITVTGAATGDRVAMGAPSTFTAGLRLEGFVSASNTVNYAVCNQTGSLVNLTSATYNAQVVK